MTYMINGLGADPRANIRGGADGMYGVGGLGSARSDYDMKAEAMRAGAKQSPFPIPENILEASIVAAIGPRPAKDSKATVPPSAKEIAVALAKQKIIAQKQACAARGGVFDPNAPGGCRLPGDPVFGKQDVGPGIGEEPKSNTMMYVGLGVAAVALFALSRR